MDEVESISGDLLKFRHPFRCAISGPTGCGKSSWLYNFLRDRTALCDVTFGRIIIFYRADQDLYDQIAKTIPGIIFVKGIPTDLVERFLPSRNPVRTLFIFDDLAESMFKLDVVQHLYTVLSHHSNCSLMSTQHQLFSKEKYARNINLQTNIYVLLKSVRDYVQVRYLASQIGWTFASPRFLTDVYRRVISQGEDYPYLVLDLQIKCPDHLRLRTGIFSSDNHQRVFVPKQT